MGQRRDRKRERPRRESGSWRARERESATQRPRARESGQFRVTRSQAAQRRRAESSGAGGSLLRVSADESERPPQQRKRCPRPSRVPNALEWPSFRHQTFYSVYIISPEKPQCCRPSTPEERALGLRRQERAGGGWASPLLREKKKRAVRGALCARVCECSGPAGAVFLVCERSTRRAARPSCRWRTTAVHWRRISPVGL